MIPGSTIWSTKSHHLFRGPVGQDMSEAGVPAKMSTRENVHLTILRQRILIRRQNSPVKRSRENVHQPRIWTPNALHFAHAVHFAHGVQNLLLTFDCRSDWFWGFGTLPDLNLPRHKTSVLLTRLFHLVLSSNFRLSKKMHMFSPSGIALHVHTTLPGWCHFQNSCRVWNTGVLFVFLISCIALSLQFLASQQNEKIKQKLRLPADKRKKEIIRKMKRHSE